LGDFPHASPLSRVDLPPTPQLAEEITSRWRVAERALLEGKQRLSESAPIGSALSAARICGGQANARRRLNEFLARGFPRYYQDRNQPELDVASGLSP